MSSELLPCVEVNPSGDVRSSVIWLHGLGANGHDFEPVVPELGIPDSWGVRFVFPHAPAIPVTINAGFVMPAWYDITTLDLKRRHDMDGVRASVGHVLRLYERERASGVPSERIVLAGFSQGGAIALHVALRLDETLAGVMCLSTYMVDAESLESEHVEANLKTPFLHCHGEFDDMVPPTRGRDAYDQVIALGHQAEWKTYPMAHQVCPPQIRDIGAWLRACVEPVGPVVGS